MRDPNEWIRKIVWSKSNTYNLGAAGDWKSIPKSIVNEVLRELLVGESAFVGEPSLAFRALEIVRHRGPQRLFEPLSTPTRFSDR